MSQKNKHRRLQVEVVVPRLDELPHYEKTIYWLVLEGPDPGVYNYSRGNFSKGYEFYEDACRDFWKYRECRLIKLLNCPLATLGEWSVVTEGFRVGVYPDRVSALVIGLKWDFGSFSLFHTEREAREYFIRELQSARVRTKLVTEVRVPHLMLPQKRVQWVIESI
ncbi:hypothetical protein PM082_013316 [Marasmius tenuissimus]|nr:hypothetical protein PM082_013316 [Marasmius tenuissimus]